MKKGPFLAAFLAAATLSAQDFSKIDEAARAVPSPKGDDVAALAKALTHGLPNEKAKARAIYAWTAEHIRYDIKTFENIMDGEHEKAAERVQPAVVLKRGKAVCEGYAALFDALCREAGLASMMVTGQSKTDGTLDPGGHSWNLVRADGEWGLVDVTWGAGDVDVEAHRCKRRFDDSYFFTPPARMATEHFPVDPLTQGLGCPMNFEFFKKRGLNQPPDCPTAVAGYAALRDSLDAAAALGEEERSFAGARRAVALDPASDWGNLTMGEHLAKKSGELFMALTQKMSEQAGGQLRLPAEYEASAKLAEQGASLNEQALECYKKVRSGEPSKRAAVNRTFCQRNLRTAKELVDYNRKMAQMARKAQQPGGH